MDIVISFEKYIPRPNIFYGYFEVLKKMKFIADVKVVCENGAEPIIKVIRNTPNSVQQGVI